MLRTDKNLRFVIVIYLGIARSGSVFCYSTDFTYTQKAFEVKEVHSVYGFAKVD
ncbi:MAG: hypothetical protein HRU78_01750 [Gammaproteobacteria bacterium]|nr:MAG: hypothetical protein HRU78_01750 [Gammaproteobacteria bacterium]